MHSAVFSGMQPVKQYETGRWIEILNDTLPGNASIPQKYNSSEWNSWKDSLYMCNAKKKKQAGIKYSSLSEFDLFYIVLLSGLFQHF